MTPPRETRPGALLPQARARRRRDHAAADARALSPARHRGLIVPGRQATRSVARVDVALRGPVGLNRGIMKRLRVMVLLCATLASVLAPLAPALPRARHDTPTGSMAAVPRACAGKSCAAPAVHAACPAACGGGCQLACSCCAHGHGAAMPSASAESVVRDACRAPSRARAPARPSPVRAPVRRVPSRHPAARLIGLVRSSRRAFPARRTRRFRTRSPMCRAFPVPCWPCCSRPRSPARPTRSRAPARAACHPRSLEARSPSACASDSRTATLRRTARRSAGHLTGR